MCLFIAIIFLSLPLVGCDSYSTGNQEIDEQQQIYEEAMKAMEDYKYAEALDLLNQIPDYKDSQERIKVAQKGTMQAKFATYIFNFVKDGGFYNPSAVRILSASYIKSSSASSESYDGSLFLKVQGTNKLGGTISKDYAIRIGGSEDGEAHSIDYLGWKFTLTDEEVDVPTINKMLIKYWQDYGIG